MHPMAGADQVQPTKEEVTNALASLDCTFCPQFAIIHQEQLIMRLLLVDFISLPSECTLRDYSHWCKVGHGVSFEFI